MAVHPIAIPPDTEREQRDMVRMHEGQMQSYRGTGNARSRLNRNLGSEGAV